MASPAAFPFFAAFLAGRPIVKDGESVCLQTSKPENRTRLVKKPTSGMGALQLGPRPSQETEAKSTIATGVLVVGP